MACRPAGMSSDELTDDDDFLGVSSRNSKRPVRNRLNSQNTQMLLRRKSARSDSPQNEQSRQEEHEIQFKALNACMSGNLEFITEYIEAGYNVNDFLYTGWTLLLYAASSVLPEVVELLIKNGAKPNKSKDGHTPLMVLCESTNGSEEQCLKCMLILIEAKANPTAHNKLMKTPLMSACKSRDVGVVTELLKYVKDIDAVDNDGRTALHYAVTANKLETVKLLLNNNASTTIADRSNLTARDIAETKEYQKIVALLDFQENADVDAFCETTRRETWSDMFPALCDDIGNMIDCDIAEILHGMGLESYKLRFKGMSLKTFLKLNEDDLVKVGIDVAMHRKQFLENLHKFHTKPWSIQSIGSIKRYLPYTLYDGVALLGNAARQIGVIGSSFLFIKNGLRKAGSEGKTLTSTQKADYEKELQKTEKTLLLLKRDLRQISKLATNVEKENRNLEPASYISDKKRKHNWTIVLSVTLITGMYLSKTSFVQRLWNN